MLESISNLTSGNEPRSNIIDDMPEEPLSFLNYKDE